MILLSQREFIPLTPLYPFYPSADLPTSTSLTYPILPYPTIPPLHPKMRPSIRPTVTPLRMQSQQPPPHTRLLLQLVGRLREHVPLVQLRCRLCCISHGPQCSYQPCRHQFYGKPYPFLPHCVVCRLISWSHSLYCISPQSRISPTLSGTLFCTASGLHVFCNLPFPPTAFIYHTVHRLSPHTDPAFHTIYHILILLPLCCCIYPPPPCT